MELSDLQIAQNIRNKDIQTYEYMIEKYSKQVYYLTYNILHGSCTKEDMEECVSDVFVDAWVNINKFDPKKASFRTWLLILTKYKALKYRRKHSRQQTVNIDDIFIQDTETIERQLISRQEQEKVIDVINGFNNVDKELFFRRYFYNEKIADLMNSMNLTRSAIDNRLSRGRKLIREVFSRE